MVEPETVEMGFSRGQADFESNLLDRGVSHQLFKILGCDCGQAETLADIISVQKCGHDELPTFYCRGCILTLEYDGPKEWDPEWPVTRRGWMNPHESTGVLWWSDDPYIKRLFRNICNCLSR